MRELTGHKVNPANDVLVVLVHDEPGAGGACHEYSIDVPASGNQRYLIKFQNGPIGEVGVNGVTHEALLAILIDRMEAFQAGPFASPFNQEALDALLDARQALFNRTKERMGRNVEGTHAQ